MNSIFNSKPPNFTMKEISKFIDEEYNLDGDLRILDSDRDQNFHIYSNQIDHILKISNPAEQSCVLELQDKATRYILARNPKIEVPIQKGPIKRKKKDGVMYSIRLLSYVKGKPLDRSRMVPEYCFKLGNLIGDLSLALDDFDHSGARRVFDWDVAQTELMAEKVKYLDSKIKQKTVYYFLTLFNDCISPLLSKLRKAVIHNDMNENNIMIRNKGLSIGIIDFGDMVYTYQVLEPSICAAYLSLGDLDPLPKVISFMKGYQSVYPLNQNEIASIPYLISLRLCLTAIMASWRKKLFPENKYLTISQQNAWISLQMMQDISLEDWSSTLIKHVQ